MRKRVLRVLSLAVMIVMVMSIGIACGNRGTGGTNGGDDGDDTNGKKISFTYEDTNYTKKLGTKTNTETFDDVIINPVTGMRDDFIMGVDASMVKTVEECGGIYYNNDGVEQDVFQILRENGVNFFRVRVWNNPFDKFGNGYGGGDVDIAAALTMAKRAKEVGMNVLVDLHYSDVWADPETQESPQKWVTKTKAELLTEVENYTAKVVQDFLSGGVKIDMIQIGNEINNGILFDNGGKIDWATDDTVKSSFDFIADVLKAGIKGAQSKNPDIYTVVHLANGGNYDEFEAYFQHLADRNVNYDIIGASYYSYYHGEMSALANNLNKVSQKFNKHVMIAELSYGFTVEQNQYAQNTYNLNMEDAGGYVTSVQGQTTYIRDCIQTVANVPDSKGLGVFYWEPAWLPVKGAAWSNIQKDGQGNTIEQFSTWANQGLFSYTGKALPSLSVFKNAKEGAKAATEVSKELRLSTVDITLNIADSETMPSHVAVVTNLDAIRTANGFGAVVWESQPSAIGTYQVGGKVENKYDITANVNVIENFIKDSSYENRGKGDEVMAPWVIESVTPAGQKVVKLENKNNYHSGKSNLNWWYSSAFSFKVKQDITGLESGNYNLSVYIQGDSTKPHTQLYIYIKGYGGEEIIQNCTVTEWNDWHKIEINGIQITSGVAEIGIVGAADAESWGHIDDWELVKA